MLKENVLETQTVPIFVTKRVRVDAGVVPDVVPHVIFSSAI